MQYRFGPGGPRRGRRGQREYRAAVMLPACRVSAVENSTWAGHHAIRIRTIGRGVEKTVEHGFSPWPAFRWRRGQ